MVHKTLQREYYDINYWKKSTFQKTHCYGNSIVDSDDVLSESDLDNISFDESFNETVIAPKPLGNNRKRKCDFLSTQADEAFDDSECFSDDDEDALMDTSLADLIDDGSQVGSTQSIYLQSVSDMVGPVKKFKMAPIHEVDISNIYSQIVAEDDDNYEMDSFCDDEIVYATDSASDSELNKSFSPATTKRKKRSTNKNVTDGKKRFKRIIIESP